MSGLKHIGQFDLESFLTSILHTCLAKSLQVEWEIHSNKTKGVPPVEDFLEFVMLRAAALSTQPTVTPTKAPESKPERRQEKKPERNHEQSYKHRAAMHVAAPSSGFRYECLLCKPEKHPLYMCSKFHSFNTHQRQEHLKANQLCQNCLAPGHKAADCRSYSRCKVCEAKHHTMVHKDAPTTPAVAANSLTPKSPSIPDILMMTAQVTLTGPGGIEISRDIYI